MNEKISELMDGELEGRAAAAALEALGREAAAGGGDALEAWRTYHVVGDTLRDTPALSADFAARVAARLAQEPTVLSPGRLKAATQRRWLAMPAAAAASAAGVALVGWLAFAPQQPGAPLPSIAKAPEAVKPAARVPLPAGTPDYLLAHQGFSPRVSLQGMAPYVRTVSDQGGTPRR